MAKLVLVMLFTCFGSSIGSGQEARRSPREQSDGTRAKVARLFTAEAEGETLTREIQQAVKDSLTGVDLETATAPEVRRRLRELLGASEELVASGEAPDAWVKNLRHGRFIVASYRLLRLNGNDAVSTVLSAGHDNGQMRVTDQIGPDFDKHGLHVREVPSPVAGEMWILAWGGELTYNGSLVRFRLYSFDGRAFKTLWKPEDMLDAKVSFSDQGFAVQYTDVERKLRQAPTTWTVRDDYVLLVDGPALRTSTLVVE